MDAEVKEVLDKLSLTVGTVKEAVLEVDKKVEAHLKEPPPLPAPAHSVNSETKSKEETGAAHSKDSANLQELQVKNDDLIKQVGILQSDTHLRRVVQDWMRGLTPEGYVELGQKLGYTDLLAESLPEGDPDAIHESALSDDPNSPRILFSETVPEGEEGWVKSEALGCFVKAE